MKIFAQGWSDNKDAPGQRWILYLKGCNFRCLYCGNPEGIRRETEVMFYPERVKSVPPEKCCPRGMKCGECSTFECVKIWRHPAFELAGKELSVRDILDKANEMRPMIDGVTFGGGEPAMQAAELLEALAGLRDMKIHTAVESNAGTEAYRELPGKTDYLISDLKAGSAEQYRRLTVTGDAALVQSNLALAAKKQKDFLIRIPLITGFNTAPDELERMRDFLAGLLRSRDELKVQTLRLHHAGAVKYRALRRDYALENVEPPEPEFQKCFDRMLRDAGLTVLDFHQS